MRWPTPLPHYPQRYRSDCLAACAAMVLNHLGYSIRYKKLLKILRVGYGGAPFRNVRFLEKLGAKVTIEQGGLADLERILADGLFPIVSMNTAELPYWQDDVYHAVVLVGMDEQFAYLNDPSFDDAPQQTPIGDFDLARIDMRELYAVLS